MEIGTTGAEGQWGALAVLANVASQATVPMQAAVGFSPPLYCAQNGHAVEPYSS
ncbi:MAG TPA: hypothetical protein VGB77_09700 [Abditibacteriaceae bacterium]